MTTLQYGEARLPWHFISLCRYEWYVVRADPSVLGFRAIYLTHCHAARLSNQRLGNGHPTENQDGQLS